MLLFCCERNELSISFLPFPFPFSFNCDGDELVYDVVAAGKNELLANPPNTGCGCADVRKF